MEEVKEDAKEEAKNVDVEAVFWDNKNMGALRDATFREGDDACDKVAREDLAFRGDDDCDQEDDACNKDDGAATSAAAAAEINQEG